MIEAVTPQALLQRVRLVKTASAILKDRIRLDSETSKTLTIELRIETPKGIKTKQPREQRKTFRKD